LIGARGETLKTPDSEKMKQPGGLLNAGGKAIIGGNLVELAQRFVRLSSELDAARDAMRRLLLNGPGPNENPTPARRPGAKGPRSNPPRAGGAAQVEETILGLLRSSPGLRTAEIAKATARKGRRQTSG
jgi:hypothetical protein